MPPKSTGTRALDHYAAHRCACKHLVYANQKPGDPRLASVVYDPPRCDCKDHRPRGSQ